MEIFGHYVSHFPIGIQRRGLEASVQVELGTM